jgi:hypothetical protein
MHVQNSCAISTFTTHTHAARAAGLSRMFRQVRTYLLQAKHPHRRHSDHRQLQLKRVSHAARFVYACKPRRIFSCMLSTDCKPFLCHAACTRCQHVDSRKAQSSRAQSKVTHPFAFTCRQIIMQQPSETERLTLCFLCAYCRSVLSPNAQLTGTCGVALPVCLTNFTTICAAGAALH